MSNEMILRVHVNTKNREQRQPLILLLDGSGSMEKYLPEVEDGLAALRSALLDDPVAKARVEIALVTFADDVAMQGEFLEATQFEPPPLSAAGSTAMSRALLFSLEAASAKKAACDAAGIACFAPWIFLVTDGAPTDTELWREAVSRVRAAEQAKHVAVFAIGTSEADMGRLQEVSSAREPLRLRDGKWREMFKWLSSSLQAKSRSRPGDAVPLEDPKKPGGWGLAP